MACPFCGVIHDRLEKRCAGFCPGKWRSGLGSGRDSFFLAPPSASDRTCEVLSRSAGSHRGLENPIRDQSRSRTTEYRPNLGRHGRPPSSTSYTADFDAGLANCGPESLNRRQLQCRNMQGELYFALAPRLFLFGCGLFSLTQAPLAISGPSRPGSSTARPTPSRRAGGTNFSPNARHETRFASGGRKSGAHARE